MWFLAGVVGDGTGRGAAVAGLAVLYLGSALVIWMWSLAVDNGSMFDAWWSVLPMAGVVWLLVEGDAGSLGASRILLVLVVFAWGIRLTLNWATGWPGLDHEDWRYLDLYTKGPKVLVSLFAVHLVPAFTVFLGSLPLVPGLWGPSAPDVNAVTVIAFLGGVKAVIVEGSADLSLRRFNRTKQPGEIIDRGLWRWSRHPNYYGEVVFWWSVWLFGVAAVPGWWWAGVGAIAITAMIRGVSIPLMDQRSMERRPGFAEYAARTYALFPVPRRAA